MSPPSRHWASAVYGAGLTPTLAACRLARRASPLPVISGATPLSDWLHAVWTPISATSETYPVQASCAALFATNI
eukprot:2055448-Heterocapsa_arctica.AAC.1